MPESTALFYGLCAVRHQPSSVLSERAIFLARVFERTSTDRAV
jgi:hypothetical protein